MTRNDLICHMVAAYEEWLGFYASAFAYWMCDKLPEQRNLLYTLVEDKRSHAIFYESLMLDYLINHPHRRAEFRVYQWFMRPLYAHLTRQMVMTMAHVAHHKELPKLFAKRFETFTDRRIRALWERAEARAPESHHMLPQLGYWTLALFSAMSNFFVALLAMPWAMMWPSREFPALEDEVHSLLKAERARA